MTNLANIRQKVRRVTGRESTNQLSNADLDDYINTYYLYDLSEQLRLNTLKEIYSFTTTENVDIYPFTPNTVLTLEPPVYVGGYEILWSQDRETYFNLYPNIQRLETLIAGNGTVGPYAGTLTAFPAKRNRVFLSAVDIGGNTLTATDTATAGIFAGDVAAGATINYATGAIAGLTWDAAIPATENIIVQYINYNAARPQAILFYNDTFQLTPVPDQAYQVAINAFVTPASLVAVNDEPQLREWWQLIAYGAALKIFADNLDNESIQKVYPLFKEQLVLVERRTLKQLSTQHSPTIYDSPYPVRQPFDSGT